MSTIVQIGPSSLSQCTISATPAKEHTTRPYQSLNKALNFADHIGVKPTIKTMKMLEQRMVNQYMYGPWSKFTNYLSDNKGLDIVDMSVAPPLQEANIIHASPMKKDDSDKEYINWPKLPYAQSPSYKPLDWGSDPKDNEGCVHPLSHFSAIHKPTESCQPPKGQSLLMDGSCSYNIT